MTYTDHYEYEKSRALDADFRTLHAANTRDKPRLFAAYAQKAIDAKIGGTMPLRDAAYAIAGTMFMTELDTPLFEEITGLAGNLELPSPFVSGDPEEGWLKLVSLVGEYSEQLK